MAETLAQLEAEYCPPLDPALLSAILSDYELDRKEDLDLARRTLESLKESAALEEAAGFDASGLGGLDEDVNGVDRDGFTADASTLQSKVTEDSSASNQLSSLSLKEDTDHGAQTKDIEHIEALDEATKAVLLNEVFGEHISQYTIQHTLSKCNGKWSAALEELLNHVYLGESADNHDSGIFNAKGIDGFLSDNTTARGRKGKSKKKRVDRLSERRSSSLPGLSDSSYESASPSTPYSKASSEATRIVPQYARPVIDGSSSDLEASTRNAKSAASSCSPSTDARSATARRDAYDLARAAALSQANDARRKAKSDHLMSGAAAHYHSVSREYSQLSHNASARAADDLVSAQSSSSQLDLHGVDVANAIRIARENVEDWWEGLGESRVNGRVGAEARQSGYRIVVGKGLHSAGGSSRIGPAVLKMLKQEGWRVEPEGGVVVVKGRVKR